MEKDGELSIVTEVGVFGDLNIENPTEKKIKKGDDLDAVIAEAIKNNQENLNG